MAMVTAVASSICPLLAWLAISFTSRTATAKGAVRIGTRLAAAVGII